MSLAAVKSEREIPFYLPGGEECALFEHAFRHRLPLLLKGPTGSGKTRFVAHMAARLGVPLITVACHDDLTAADLTGRYLLRGGETQWVDGPLTRAVRHGGICYLDEVVEARKDVTVVLHPLDRRPPHPAARAHRRDDYAAPRLHACRFLQPGLPECDEVAEAEHPPALRRARLRLPARKRRRSRSSPPKAACRRRDAGLWSCSPIVCARSPTSISRRVARPASSSMLRRLIVGGMRVDDAVRAAMIEPLTDDIETRRGLVELMRVTLG